MAEQHRVLRFGWIERAEHWVTMLSFTVLAVTGLVQKYATAQISVALVALLGGPEIVRIIHRVAAFALMLEAVFHVGYVGYKVYVLRVPMTMLPGLSDVRAAWGVFLYNLGLRDERPQQGRYTFEEKFEYWALIWGTIIMGVTGFLMWNPITASRILPAEFIPAAKAAHGGEAVLAVLAILIWHVYHVHLRHFNRSMFTGYLEEEEMLEEHPLELAQLKAGAAHRPPDPQTLRRRKRTFFAVYSVVAAVMLAGVAWFVAGEETAIETVPPPEDVVVFAPLTPTPFPTAIPTATSAAGQPTTWEDGFAELFTSRCGSCHGKDTAIGGLDLSTYPSALQGGQSGPGIVPGDPDSSLVLIRQAEGNHPSQLSAEEILWLREWIEAGAPER